MDNPSQWSRVGREPNGCQLCSSGAERAAGHRAPFPGVGWRVAVHRETGASLGFVALNFAGEGAGIAADEYEIGWWLEPPVWGRGLAREGAEAICREAFERVWAPSVVARIAPGNAASLGVAGAIRMVPEGEGRVRKPTVP
ncbi:MAG: GNAT family N-acetyltransferase [Solirubrobacteraceae bacterium]